MNKPRIYELKRSDRTGGLLVEAEEDESGRCVVIDTQYSRFMGSRNCRALAKRLLEMADWIEDKDK